MKRFYIISVLFLLSTMYNCSGNKPKENPWGYDPKATSKIIEQFKTGKLKDVVAKDILEFHNFVITHLKKRELIVQFQTEHHANMEAIMVYNDYSVEEIADSKGWMNKIEAMMLKICQINKNEWQDQIFMLSTSFTKDIFYPLINKDITYVDENTKVIRDILKNEIGSPEDTKDQKTLYGVIKKITGQEKITREEVKKMIDERKIVSFMPFFQGLPSGIFYRHHPMFSFRFVTFIQIKKEVIFPTNSCDPSH